MISVIDIFVYLQLLDFLTTMAGFGLGASEVSPFIVKLIHATSPVWGVAAAKLLGLGLGGYFVFRKKIRLIGLINYWYAGLIVWNLSILVALGQRFAH
ncbi:MAG TPA: hypothetical protein VK789_33005 [Bryobacteraceae bacterium]|jgi:hypothetical protein|nr:hypothetical protein [Bryobacteraceae bacterium]